jgi:predicted naringenin-chalcone synthase
MSEAYLQRIATAVPGNDVHALFQEFAEQLLTEDLDRRLFRRMAAKSGIAHRFSFLEALPPYGPDAVVAAQLYRLGGFPSTAERMRLFERFAPVLAARALDRLLLTPEERDRTRHVIVTCCTGLYAPGLDFAIIDHLGLSPSAERTTIGFMGCYAAINGLKQARHIIRSDPGAMALLVNLELCTLHLQQTRNLEEVLSFLIFGDGCAASLIGSEECGLRLDGADALQIDGTRGLITWRVGDSGFDMHLSGRAPGEIARALSGYADRLRHCGASRPPAKPAAGSPAPPIDLWAVHPGGRTILDAVQKGLGLPPAALQASREVLSRFGNMSSASVMFVLQDLMQKARPGNRGCAMSFGPGMTAEILHFHAV